MKQYIVYNITTGEIVRYGSCSETDFELQPGPGEGVIEGVGTSKVNYVFNNTILSYTPDHILAKENIPFYKSTWSNETFQWIDLRTEQEKYDQFSNIVRIQRAQLLADSDWTDTLSAKTRLGEELYNAWQVYRQVLRDIPLQPGFPFEVLWPIAPQ